MACLNERLDFFRKSAITNYNSQIPAHLVYLLNHAISEILLAKSWLHNFFANPDHELARRLALQDCLRLFFLLAVVIQINKLVISVNAKHGECNIKHRLFKRRFNGCVTMTC
ncbi:putative ATP-binding protein [Escherichia phage PGN590]|uniref:Putative ATP-binding protein n=1 Tax=Escherichia phage PGN590 TaxID=2714735 RepID=A0A6M9EF67_9CAUD|nr:putative ATP-binding protein [Escherichia phage PGN590]QKL16928.1 putative ATP-binding protein [Escherichia phage PGN590]